MANELRIRANFQGGLVEDNPLSSGATTLTSAGLGTLPAVTSTSHMAIILDPDGRAGALPEIVYVTAHTALATTATVVRGREGTTARAHDRDTPWTHGPTRADYDAAGGGVGLIGLTTYNPAGQATYSSASTSYADMDATNLAVPFTVPPSGKVLIRLSARVNLGANTTMGWNLRESAADVAGTSEDVAYWASSSGGCRVSYSALLSALTPGAAKTYKWGHARIFGSSTCETFAGGAPSAAVMEVWAVNL